MPTQLGAQEMLFSTDAIALAMASPLVVQVRRGLMTEDGLTPIERRVRELKARFTPGRRLPSWRCSNRARLSPTTR